jgi:hypothetical protein
MPIRFFIPIKLGKGLHLNVSKSGLGLSQRIGPVTLGTRRTSLDLPGTGASLYFNNAKKGPASKRNLAGTPVTIWGLLIGSFLVIMSCICIAFSSLIILPPLATPTAPAAEIMPQAPIRAPLINTSAPQPTQTSADPTRTSLPTRTKYPTVDHNNTQLPRATQPIWTQEPATPFATLPIIVPPVASGPSITVCSCNANLYNCSDFNTRARAQACYNACVSNGKGDIHQLDKDNNGQACESLP